MLNYQMNTQSVETCLGQSYPKNNIRDGGSTPLYTAYTVYNAQTVTCMPTYIVLKTGGPPKNQTQKRKGGKLGIFCTTVGKVFLHLL